MAHLQLICDVNSNRDIIGKIIEDSRPKWGDSEDFLTRLFSKGEILGVAKESDGSIVGFSLAKRMVARKSIAVAFLATRVLPDFRKQGVAKKLIKKISSYFVVTNKLIEFFFNPPYQLVFANATDR